MVNLRHRRASGDSRANRNGGIGSTNNDSLQRSRSDAINSSGHLSQNNDLSPVQPPSRQRGRKRRATTELRVPPRGRRVGLEPHGDRYVYLLECVVLSTEHLLLSSSKLMELICCSGNLNMLILIPSTTSILCNLESFLSENTQA